MRGLIEKDIRLTLIRKQTLFIFLAMALVMGISMDGTFVITYLTMLAMIAAIGTISYDEFDNGFAFLMTLPFGRKTYVKEKYLFSLIMTVAAWCFGVVVNIAITISRHGGAGLADDLIMATAAIPSIYMVVGIIIPLQLKYGSEKSRLVLFGIFGICAVLIYAVKTLPIDVVKPLVGLFNSLQGLPGYTILLTLVIACIVVTFVSYMISARIMEKKEF